MPYYLYFALVFAVVYGWLCYYSYKNQKPSLLFAGGMLFLAILRVNSAFFDGIWNTDEAEWISVAYGLQYCDVPYLCYDGHSSGFVNIFLLEILYFLGIEYSYASLRLLGLFLFLLPSVLFFYLTVKRMYGKREVILGLGLLLHFLLFGAYNHDMLAYDSEYPIMLFTAILFYCFTLYRQQKGWGSLVVAALCIGILPFCKLQAVPIAGAFGFLVAIEAFKHKKIFHVFVFGAVGLIPLVIIFLVFRKMGIWDNFWTMYIESNQYLVKHYTSMGSWQKIKVFAYTQRWVAPYYIIGLVFLWVAYRQKKLNRQIIRKVDWSPVIILLCGWFASGATGSGAEHYNTLIFIPLFLVLCNWISLFDTVSWMEKGKNLLRYHITLVGIALLFISLPETNRFVKRLYDDAWPRQDKLIAYVQETIAPGKPLCVLGWFQAVEIQVDCKRPLATRTAHNFYLKADKDPALMQYYQQQYIQDLEISKPILIVDPSKELDIPQLAPLKEYILKHYRLDSIIEKNVVYKRISI